VKDEARKSFGHVKRANQKPTLLSYDVALLSGNAAGYPDYP
jgi:hypothetical protein